MLSILLFWARFLSWLCICCIYIVWALPQFGWRRIFTRAPLENFKEIGWTCLFKIFNIKKRFSSLFIGGSFFLRYLFLCNRFLKWNMWEWIKSYLSLFTFGLHLLYYQFLLRSGVPIFLSVQLLIWFFFALRIFSWLIFNFIDQGVNNTFRSFSLLFRFLR